MSKIEWTEKTWNPTTGCDKVSEGCRNCYAEVLAETRLHKMQPDGYRFKFQLTHHRDRLETPLKWKNPEYIFVNSMSDLFHAGIERRFLLSIFSTMHRAPWHVYQILTKRGKRLAELGPHLPWHENIWMGVSVENDELIGAGERRPTHRIDDLRASGAMLKFLSMEPLLGPVPNLDLRDIDWLIIGGESGKDAREMKLEWVEQIIQQCRDADVAVFVKQLGEVWAREYGSDRHGARMYEWPERLRIREMPREGMSPVDLTYPMTDS